MVLGYLYRLNPKVKQGIVDLNNDDCLAIEKSNDEECCACTPDNILIKKNGLSSNCDIKGKCNCKENYKDEKCNQCQEGFFGYPKCSECGCNEFGSIGKCDQQGKCTCKPRSSGPQCNLGNRIVISMSVDFAYFCSLISTITTLKIHYSLFIHLLW